MSEENTFVSEGRFIRRTRRGVKNKPHINKKIPSRRRKPASEENTFVSEGRLIRRKNRGAKTTPHKKLVPIQNNFPTLPRIHNFKSLLIIIHRITVGHNWSNIQTSLNQTCHFIPSFKHLSTIDAFDL